MYMNALIRNSSELETYVVSVERVDEYATVAPEVEQLCVVHNITLFHTQPFTDFLNIFSITHFNGRRLGD